MTSTDQPQVPAPLAALSAAGVSIWLDDLSRPMITGGDLLRLTEERAVVGITTNPTIFASAMAQGESYSAQVAELAAAGADVEQTVLALTTTDVRDACDALHPIYEATGGTDGRVSIEVDPRLAHDTAGTVAAAEKLWAEVDRPNVMIKIPATVEGLPAISQALSAGISVNVTLIFSLDRYRGVMNAYLTGLEQARRAGIDVSTIRSVASFFVSRVDSEVDARLDQIGGSEALELRGKAALANARLAYQAFQEVFGTPRWQNLADDGAQVQRPLWASTGVKNTAYPDTLYVDGLVAPDTVNTMPAATMEATAEHGQITADTVTDTYEHSQQVLDDLERVGVSYVDVVEQLEREGVSKFSDSWAELLETVGSELAKAAEGSK